MTRKVCTCSGQLESSGPDPVYNPCKLNAQMTNTELRRTKYILFTCPTSGREFAFWFNRGPEVRLLIWFFYSKHKSTADTRKTRIIMLTHKKLATHQVSFLQMYDHQAHTPTLSHKQSYAYYPEQFHLFLLILVNINNIHTLCIYI